MRGGSEKINGGTARRGLLEENKLLAAVGPEGLGYSLTVVKTLEDGAMGWRTFFRDLEEVGISVISGGGQKKGLLYGDKPKWGESESWSTRGRGVGGKQGRCRPCRPKGRSFKYLSFKGKEKG